MSDKRIFSFIDTLTNLISNLRARQRGIDTDLNKNWVYKDDSAVLHVTANQKKWISSAWVYENNDFGSTIFHGLTTENNPDYVAVFDSNGLLCAMTPANFAGIHTHNSLSNGGSEMTLLSNDIITIPPRTDVGMMATESSINFYKLEGEAWVLKTQIEL
jgi:hypothetical protein